MPAIEILESCTLLAVVAMFDDPQYVVSLGTVRDSAKNIRTVLENAGHEVRSIPSLWPFGTKPNDFLGGVDVLLLPKITHGDIRSPFLLYDGMNDIKRFVENGGGILSVGNERGGLFNTDLLNDVFGWNIDFQYYYDPKATIRLKPPSASGTGFAGGPAVLPKNDDTFMLSEGYPPATKFIYAYEAGQPLVTRTTVGSGVVTQLAWGWENAAPLGTQDGGWNDVLRRAVRDAVEYTPPTSTTLNGILTVHGTDVDDVITVASKKIGGRGVFLSPSMAALKRSWPAKQSAWSLMQAAAMTASTAPACPHHASCKEAAVMTR